MAYGDSLKTSLVKIQDIKSILDTLFLNYQYVESTGSINTTSNSSVTMSGTTTGNVVVPVSAIVYLHYFVVLSNGTTEGDMSIFLQRSGTQISSFKQYFYVGDTSGEALTVCSSYIDIPPWPGTYTYNLNWAVATSQTAYATSRGLLAVARTLN